MYLYRCLLTSQKVVKEIVVQNIATLSLFLCVHVDQGAQTTFYTFVLRCDGCLKQSVDCVLYFIFQAEQKYKKACEYYGSN